jgi:hypothetical protein
MPWCSRFILSYRSIKQYGRFPGSGDDNGFALPSPDSPAKRTCTGSNRIAVAIKLHFTNFKQA